jgi:enoyl-CoA hydratase
MSEVVEPDLSVELRGKIAVITILGEKRYNAQRRTFWGSLRTVLTDLEKNPSIAAAVITGEGSKAFSAGGDIIGYKQLTTTDERRDFIVDCMRTFEAVEMCTKPIIAAVNGIAAGGGCELASACDIVLAAPNAKFAVPESALGLVPGFGVTRLADIVGVPFARYMVLTGEFIDAETALRVGLVQEIAREGSVLDRAIALAEQIASKGPIAVSVGKALINRALETSYLSSVDAIVMLQGTQDAQEGITAFEERRSPRFTRS